MKTILFTLAFAFAAYAFAENTPTEPQTFWHLSNIRLNNGDLIRTGYLPAADEDKSFKGNVIYYEGLADSMINHLPLFTLLANAGFRVIAFDYMGQGGSTGTMNNTRISEIDDLGAAVFKELHKTGCATCEDVNIIGWSTGGLATYRAAYIDQGKTIKKVVLIAPGIWPKLIIGDGLISWPVDHITVPTLTSADYTREPNPHFDAIRPATPLDAISFVIDLLDTAFDSWKWKIGPDVKGLVLLSDPNFDKYVHGAKTASIVKTNTSFATIFYPGARHEIDNETRAISTKARQDILNFMIAD